MQNVLGNILGKSGGGMRGFGHKHRGSSARWKRVAFGKERDYDGAPRCGDCGVKPGHLHKRNCDMEVKPDGEQVGGDYEGAY